MWIVQKKEKTKRFPPVSLAVCITFSNNGNDTSVSTFSIGITFSKRKTRAIVCVSFHFKRNLSRILFSSTHLNNKKKQEMNDIAQRRFKFLFVFCRRFIRKFWFYRLIRLHENDDVVGRQKMETKNPASVFSSCIRVPVFYPCVPGCACMSFPPLFSKIHRNRWRIAILSRRNDSFC